MVNVNPTNHEANDDHVYLIEVSTTCGKTLIWHKNGGRHHISEDLGTTWVTHFKPDLFDITPDGEFHPAGDKPNGMKIAGVRLVHQDEVAG